jgi:hypothetical protein
MSDSTVLGSVWRNYATCAVLVFQAKSHNVALKIPGKAFDSSNVRIKVCCHGAHSLPRDLMGYARTVPHMKDMNIWMHLRIQTYDNTYTYTNYMHIRMDIYVMDTETRLQEVWRCSLFRLKTSFADWLCINVGLEGYKSDTFSFYLKLETGIQRTNLRNVVYMYLLARQWTTCKENSSLIMLDNCIKFF